MVRIPGGNSHRCGNHDGGEVGLYSRLWFKILIFEWPLFVEERKKVWVYYCTTSTVFVQSLK